MPDKKPSKSQQWIRRCFVTSSCNHPIMLNFDLDFVYIIDILLRLLYILVFIYFHIHFISKKEMSDSKWWNIARKRDDHKNVLEIRRAQSIFFGN